MSRRTVDLIDALREYAAYGTLSRAELNLLLLDTATRLELFAWDGLPPRTPHLAAESSPDAGDVDAGASPPTRRADPGGGEVRLASTAMPLAATEFSEPDPCNPHGVVRPVLHRGLYVVTP